MDQSLQLESQADASPLTNSPARGSHLAGAVWSHALLRIASGANGLLIGLYLAHLNSLGAAHAVQLVGTLSAVSFAAELLASLPMGVLADAVHTSRLVTAGAVIGAGAALLFMVAHSVPMFLLSRLLEGIAAAAVVPALLAYLTINTQHDRGLRARVMSYFELSLLGGLAFGGIVASQLFRWLHAKAFLGIACMYLLCALLLFFATRGGKQAQAQSPLAGLKHAWKLPALRRLAPVWLCVNSIVGLWLGSTLPFLLTHPRSSNQFLDGVFADQPSRVGIMLLAYSGVFGLGVTLWSVVLPRMSLQAAMRITLGAMLPVCAGLYLFNHTAPAAERTRWLLGTLTAVAIMVESGFTPAALAWLAGTLPAKSGRGAAMGIYSVLLSLGAILGSLLAGFLGNRYAIDGLLYATAAAALIALVCLRWVPAQNPLERQREASTL